jgi:MATE efflux family protein
MNYFCTVNINREILRLAIPAIVTNITVPLLGLVDTTIAGHLGMAEYIGALAVGSMMFNMIYWNFAFLRMGTSGLTAQAFGANNPDESVKILIRATSLGAFIGVLILLLQIPIEWVALEAIKPSGEVTGFAKEYFRICIWGAPALLMVMGIKGWFIGMQNSTHPMIIALSVNIINIIASLCAVFVFKMGFRGIAYGTVTAEYCGLIISFFILSRSYKEVMKNLSFKGSLKLKEMKRFFNVNSDIFIRSLCLMSVTLAFVSIGARSGNIILAVNALIMQLFILFSYFMDGFAFAAEALVGRFEGAGEKAGMNRCINYLFKWGFVVMALFALVYGFGNELIFKILTNKQEIINTALDYRLWSVLIPVAGVAAFIWDGIFIGLTATKQMLYSLFIASAFFFGIYFIIPGEPDNNRLWLAFISYLGMRGIAQWIMFRRVIKNKITR